MKIVVNLAGYLLFFIFFSVGGILFSYVGLSVAKTLIGFSMLTVIVCVGIYTSSEFFKQKNFKTFKEITGMNPFLFLLIFCFLICFIGVIEARVLKKEMPSSSKQITESFVRKYVDPSYTYPPEPDDQKYSSSGQK